MADKAQKPEAITCQATSLTAESGSESVMEVSPNVQVHDRVMDAYYGRMGNDLMRMTHERVHWICAQVDGKRILDVGCSQGIVPILLGRESKSVLGLDVDADAIAVAENYLAAGPRHASSNVNFVVADFLAHDFSGEQFDTIVMSEVLEHLVDPEAFVERAASLLKPSGRLVVTVPFGINDYIDHKHTYYLVEPYQLLSRWFEISTIRMFGHWIGFAGNLRKQKLSAPVFDETLRDSFKDAERCFNVIERDLASKLLMANANLASANEKYRVVTQNLQKLKSELAQALQERQLESVKLNERNVHLNVLLGVHQSTKDTLQKDLNALRAEHMRLKDEFVEKAAAHAQAKETLQALQVKLKQSAERVRELTQTLEEMEMEGGKAAEQTAHLNKLLEASRTSEAAMRQDLENERGSVMKLQKELNNVQERANRLRDELSQATCMVEEAHENAEKISEQTKEEADKLAQQYSAAQLELERIRDSREQAEKELSRLRNRLAGMLTEKNRWMGVAQSVAQDVENEAAQTDIYARSITFQTGIAVQRAFTSLRGLVKLPGYLLKLRKEARRRHSAALTQPDAWKVVVPVDLPRHNFRSALTLELSTSNGSASEKTAGATLPDASESSKTVESISPVSMRMPVFPETIKELRMAAIMDEFTFGSFDPCCDVQQLTPLKWQQQLETQQPHLLFIESAWRGKDELWKNSVGTDSTEIAGIMAWCRARRIPTMFWNKEDPVHFETFLSFAQGFDYIFTTDIDCIGRYKAALGHDRVYFLPFACQPTSNNPIEKYQRKDAFCFAGAYYVRYPERQRDFDTFIDALSTLAPVEIYDRNYGKDDPNYQFPERYQGLIKGTLPFDKIDLAYKGYRFAINLNSVKHSQTMFARRVFDLLGSNTVTVSNYSHGLRLMFGDLAITTDSGDQLINRLGGLLGGAGEMTYRKHRLAGLRKVLTEHTYADRLAYILAKVTGRPYEKALPEIVAVAAVADSTQERSAIAAYDRQAYAHKRMVMVTQNGYKPEHAVDSNIMILTRKQAIDWKINSKWGDMFVARLRPSDYYGSNYLTDMALATLYVDADVIGKSAYFTAEHDQLNLKNDSHQYRKTESIAWQRAIVRAKTLNISLQGWLDSDESAAVGTGSLFAVDEFNYVANGGNTQWPEADDLANLYKGLTLRSIQSVAESVAAQRFEIPEGVRCLDGDALAQEFALPRETKDLVLKRKGDGMEIRSTLPRGKHWYEHAKRYMDLDPWTINGKLHMHVNMRTNVSVEPTLLFYDGNDKKLTGVVTKACRNVSINIPETATRVRLSLRVKGPGDGVLEQWVLGHVTSRQSVELGDSDCLLVTNCYPSYDNLYRNAFVHRRVVGYRKHGLRPDVFCLQDVGNAKDYEYDDVDVSIGWKDRLRSKLASGRYRVVLVHFLDRAMWDVLKDYVATTRILVWIHGSEIQHWRQRTFNYRDEAEKARAVALSDERMAFWRDVLEYPHPNLHLIFVSQWFEESATKDVGVKLAREQYSIIHNAIDTALFEYVPKDVEQRWNLLSIRPYSTHKYANDLTVAAIRLLQDAPEFSRMRFRLIGDGVLFAETVAPIADLPNVEIEQRFLTQNEIATLHKQYGLFLVPTRMDSQGVSRDEAMSSGLVPVTTGVTAIPEFVDDTCGLVAPAEDAERMAELILQTVRSPETFLRLSAAAAERVRRQCGEEQTLMRELALIQASTATAKVSV